MKTIILLVDSKTGDQFDAGMLWDDGREIKTAFIDDKHEHLMKNIKESPAMDVNNRRYDQDDGEEFLRVLPEAYHGSRMTAENVQDNDERVQSIIDKSKKRLTVKILEGVAMIEEATGYTEKKKKVKEMIAQQNQQMQEMQAQDGTQQ